MHDPVPGDATESPSRSSPILQVAQVFLTGGLLLAASLWAMGMRAADPPAMEHPGVAEQQPSAPITTETRWITTPRQPITLFIVASAEQVRSITSNLGDGNTEIAALGKPNLNYSIAVAQDAEEAADIVERYAVAYSSYSQSPQDLVRIVNLRNG